MMEDYLLIDGAMAFDALRESPFLATSSPDWFAPVFAHKDLRLAGPVLFAFRRVKENGPEWNDIARITGAFPRRLHMSLMRSSLAPSELAEHLRYFACFTESSGATYGLRIGDARVIPHLPKALTADQWNALTAPMTYWEVSNRTGTRDKLTLSEARLQTTFEPAYLHLNSEQIDKLIEATEPDALLAHINKAPTLASERQTLARYETACTCIRRWKSSGLTNRATLVEFARLVFRHGIANRSDDKWMAQRLKEAVSTTT